MSIKLSQSEMQYITTFQRIVDVYIKDCVVDDEENKITYVVSEGQAGMAIGKKGIHINKLKELVAKDVEIIEFSNNLEKFIKNCFLPIIIKSIRVDKKKDGSIAHVEVSSQDKGRAIGRNGKNINKVKMIVQRQYENVDVAIKQ